MAINSYLLVFALCLWNVGASECDSGSSDTCQDSTGLLQSKVSIAATTDDEYDENEDLDVDVDDPLFGIFDKVDANQNGKIDRSEFEQAVSDGKLATHGSSDPGTDPAPTSPPLGGTTMAPPTLPPDSDDPDGPMPTNPPKQFYPDRVPVNVVPGQPYVCSTPGDPKTFSARFCWCNGDVYYGKRYKSGNSGAEVTYEEMTKGGCDSYSHSAYQKDGCKVKKYGQLKTSARAHPGWKWTLCSGCMSWGDRYFHRGSLKQCYCMPSKENPTPTTLPPTPAPPPFTFAPGPGPNEGKDPWALPTAAPSPSTTAPPAPPPTPPPAAQCDESSRGLHNKDYRGCQAKTESGRTCQRWDSQSPHSHSNTPERRPNAGLKSNFCRNPDGEPRIWCYTTDPKKRWEFCNPLPNFPPR